MAISPHVRHLRDALGPELLVLPSATGIVFDDRDRILLVREAETGVWSAPGGVIEPNETPADAVVREVWEETGLETTPIRLLGVYGGPHCLVIYPNGDRTSYVMTVFECAVRSGELRTRTDETLGAAYVAVSEIDKLETSSWVRHVLPGLYDRSRSARFEPSTWRPPAF